MPQTCIKGMSYVQLETFQIETFTARENRGDARNNIAFLKCRMA